MNLVKLQALFCAVAALALVGCSPRPAAAPQAVADGADQVPAAAAPQASARRYSYEEHGVFGYAQEVSADDRARGVTSLPMVLVRYDGRRGDMYGFKSTDDGGHAMVLSCREPCAAMKVETYGLTTLDTKIMPIAPDSVLEAIVQDARNGYLDHGIPRTVQSKG